MPERGFYVGYLPIPKDLRRFLLLVVPVWTVVAFVVSGLIASAQRDPGPGVWSDQTETMSGVVWPDPYPHLLVPGEREDELARTVWLVEPGKIGGGKRAEPWMGRAVSISGLRLERDGNLMLEMALGEGAIRASEEAGAAMAAFRHKPIDEGEVTLTGEILDGKCFLGAMKPGDGKAHKACAVRCISGGIPAMFASPRADGSLDYFVVTDGSGGPMDRSLLEFVGEPVEVSGRVSTRGGVRLLAIGPGGVRRR